jgi:hypothetical protein
VRDVFRVTVTYFVAKLAGVWAASVISHRFFLASPCVSRSCVRFLDACFFSASFVILSCVHGARNGRGAQDRVNTRARCAYKGESTEKGSRQGTVHSKRP